MQQLELELAYDPFPNRNNAGLRVSFFQTYDLMIAAGIDRLLYIAST